VIVPSTENNRLDGMVAVVTGGSRGIGRATALALAGRGADVAVLSRTVEASEKVAADIRALGNARTFAGAGDVCAWADVEHVVDQVTAALGPIDILVSSAGMGGRHGYVWNLDPDTFRATLTTNLLGPFHLMKAVLPRMVERQHGVVVNISSGVALRAQAGRAMYSTSKAALDFLSRAAAIEAAPSSVRVYSFYPGATDTDMQAELRSDPGTPAELRAELQARLTQGRLFTPDQPAAAIAWLASPAGAAWTDPICGWSTPTIREQIERLPGYVPG
jgi:3-oxoacyl-[acyl-carrier protein] reductase